MVKIIEWLVTLVFGFMFISLFAVVFQYGTAIQVEGQAQQNALWVAQVKGGVDENVRSVFRDSLANSTALQVVSLNGTPVNRPFGDTIIIQPKVAFKYTFLGKEFEENIAWDQKGTSLYTERK